MTEPRTPKYGPAFDPNAQTGGGTDPNKGDDLSYLDPTVKVAWSTPPSYNEDPQGSGGKPDDTTAPPCEPVKADLSSMRTAETTMLGSARTAVGDYTELRTKVLAVKDTIFGQQLVDVEPDKYDAANQAAGGGPSPYDTETPNPMQKPGKEFADSINPAQEKALWQIANALEAVGQYIAAVNTAGQSYGKTDRGARFPAPPAQ